MFCRSAQAHALGIPSALRKDNNPSPPYLVVFKGRLCTKVSVNRLENKEEDSKVSIQDEDSDDDDDDDDVVQNSMKNKAEVK